MSYAQKWSFIWGPLSTLDEHPKYKDRMVSRENRASASELLVTWLRPVVGHSFLLRSIHRSGADHLMFLTVLDASKDGTSFSWRELKRFDR